MKLLNKQNKITCAAHAVLHSTNTGVKPRPYLQSLQRARHDITERCRVRATSKVDSEASSPASSGEVSGKLFSSVGYTKDNKLKHAPGRVSAATALVAGTTVGAGILAVPFVTEESGFLAASGAMTGMWLYSVLCGLLLAEVNLNTLGQLGRDGATITTMAERTLGETGSKAVSASYLFLHCAMLVAYIARGGEIISQAAPVSAQAASVAFAGGLGVVCYGLKPTVMDAVNSFLVVGVVLTFLALLGTAAPGVDGSALLKADFSAVPKTLPVLSLAFVFHNIIPIISTSLEGDVKKIRTAVVAGTGIPLLMFLAWDAAILGSLGQANSSGADPLQTLIRSEPVVGPLVQVFSFLAVTTSFIGFLFGLADFVGDLLGVPSGEKSPLSFAVCIVPPTLLALSYPDVFFKALDYAGTYGVLLLFGLTPAAMAWSERYNEATLSTINVVPGGRPGLIVLGGIAAAIIGNSAYGSLSSLFFK